MIIKNIIFVNGVKVIIVWFLRECKENNVLSFLYNLFLVIMYICWKMKGEKERFVIW